MWDNILAFGTRFIFNLSLSLLYLLKDQLMDLDFADINEFFKLLKDDSHLEEKLLPPYDDIIDHAQRIHISEDVFNELFQKHDTAPKSNRPAKPTKKLNKVVKKEEASETVKEEPNPEPKSLLIKTPE